jgi:hypothetical protein
VKRIEMTMPFYGALSEVMIYEEDIFSKLISKGGDLNEGSKLAKKEKAIKKEFAKRIQE